jgi:Flp pilus assembly pilin Flp
MHGNRDRTDRERARIVRDETGATMTEYGLVTFLIAILLISSVAFFGDSLDQLYGSIVDALPF